MQDRRIFERIAASFPMKYWDIQANRIGEARIADVSANGVGFTSSERLAPGVKLGMWLEIPDKKEHLYTQGAVAWSRPMAGDTYRIGVELVKPELMGVGRVLRLSRNFA
ncbi:MAG: PilZ domain-containing protein [Candidatus Omnitrophica bacterium]|nr:PilZ domain-containing protein [Candidatus Omnitrophota bacterium]